MLERLRVIAWSHYVMVAAGSASIEDFEKRYSKPKGIIYLSSGLWAKYMRGEVIPQGSLSGARSSLVERLDKAYPATAAIFHHPVWPLLDFDRLLGPARLQEYLWTMGLQSRKSLIHVPVAVTGPGKLPFWKLHATDMDQSRKWSDVPGLDGLAICLIEARLAYLAQRENLFVNSILGAMGRIERLGKSEAFQPKRMQTALLLVEGLCIRYAQCMVSEAQSAAKDHEKHVDGIRRWARGHEARRAAHLASLSISSANTFNSWMRKIRADDCDCV